MPPAHPVDRPAPGARTRRSSLAGAVSVQIVPLESQRPFAGRVLITGTSTGIGRACARRLAGAGWQVFAGVRNQRDAESLAAEPGGIQPVILDVTDPEQVRAAAALVGRTVGGEGLQALINNSGISVGGPLEVLPIEEFRRQLEVNLVGTLAVIQALLPLLRKGGGRIVNIGSSAGYIAFPCQGLYAASKFGLEGLTHVLRQELRPQGIGVTMIAPGPIATPIWKKSIAAWEDMWAGIPEADIEPYRGMVAVCLRMVDEAAQGAAPVEEVTAAIHLALTRKKAPARIDVGANSRRQRAAALFGPDRWWDDAVHRTLRRRHLPEDGELPVPDEVAEPASKSVLVTGAAGGIGGAVVRQLASRGYRVFAGMLPGELEARTFDGQEGSITPVALDVTDPASISAAAAQVEDELVEKGLAGLVNSAGILHYAPLEFLPLEEFRHVLEVNLLGTLAVTRALLPSLRKAQGRIVNVGSIAGIFTVPLQGAYSASKFALEGLTDSLRRELAFWEIPVSLLQPVAVKSPMQASAAVTSRRLWDAMPDEAGILYGRHHRMLLEELEGEMHSPLELGQVVDAALHALEARRPRTRYLLGKHVAWHWLLVRLTPRTWSDWMVERVLRSRHPGVES